LHNKKNLMEELKKMNRIIDREFPNAHRENLIVLDGTTGQNALAQAKEFGEVTNLTGIILTKMDGTAKGGIAVAIQSELNVPVKYIGVGEKIEDLQKFNSDDFVNALFDIKNDEEDAETEESIIEESNKKDNVEKIEIPETVEENNLESETELSVEAVAEENSEVKNPESEVSNLEPDRLTVENDNSSDTSENMSIKSDSDDMPLFRNIDEEDAEVEEENPKKKKKWFFW
ncbi:MAG: signal recognition particle-docking protein FtsY, partial [Lachnospiraceae bacterium]|nr:signal recognition particle-docking protein FtsY [Lachnospiraceae bacterium]